LLRGPAICRAAVQVLLDHAGRPEAMHYRDWYELLVVAGYTVAGKDPLTVFLTQLGRSPSSRAARRPASTRCTRWPRGACTNASTDFTPRRDHWPLPPKRPPTAQRSAHVGPS
jgi:hypothetical protein